MRRPSILNVEEQERAAGFVGGSLDPELGTPWPRRPPDYVEALPQPNRHASSWINRIFTFFAKA
jgi:hypothetical protein